MKSKSLRSLLAALCCALVACVNPYLAQMDQLDADYRAGLISRTEYNRRVNSLNARSDAWAAQNSANAALGAAAIVGAAHVGSALIRAEATEDLAHSVNQNNRSRGGQSSGNKSAPKKSSSKGKSKPNPPSQGGGSPPAGSGSPPAGGGGPPSGNRPAGGPPGNRPPPQ